MPDLGSGSDDSQFEERGQMRQEVSVDVFLQNSDSGTLDKSKQAKH